MLNPLRQFLAAPASTSIHRDAQYCVFGRAVPLARYHPFPPSQGFFGGSLMSLERSEASRLPIVSSLLSVLEDDSLPGLAGASPTLVGYSPAIRRAAPRGEQGKPPLR
jgi:hypothetical protein